MEALPHLYLYLYLYSNHALSPIRRQQKGGAGPEGSGRPVLSLCESGEPRESAGVTAERWSQRQDPSPSGGAGAAGACYYTGALQHKGEKR